MRAIRDSAGRTLIGSGAAREKLGLSEGQWWRLLRLGHIAPAVRPPGGMPRFDLAEVEKLRDRLREPATAGT